MSEQEQKTVADVLYNTLDNPFECMMYEGLETRQDLGAMGYEDWVRPMKLTGGRVCLRADRPDGFAPVWYCWQSDGLRASAGTIRAEKPARAVAWLKESISATTSTLTPVLREDTPFSEDEHE